MHKFDQSIVIKKTDLWVCVNAFSSKMFNELRVHVSTIPPLRKTNKKCKTFGGST